VPRRHGRFNQVSSIFWSFQHDLLTGLEEQRYDLDIMVAFNTDSDLTMQESLLLASALRQAFLNGCTDCFSGQRLSTSITLLCLEWSCVMFVKTVQGDNFPRTLIERHADWYAQPSP